MFYSSEIIEFFYDGMPSKEILLLHSGKVRDKALEIAASFPDADMELVSEGAMLHDIGIVFCDAPSIGCFGDEKYLLHGILGAENLRAMKIDGIEKIARICERHTGSGLTADEIRAGKLPLPERDLLPETLEEKIICLADKFYSKSDPDREKSLPEIRREMEKFGKAPLERFDRLCTDLKGTSKNWLLG